jgi:hypothetical protein
MKGYKGHYNTIHKTKYGEVILTGSVITIKIDEKRYDFEFEPGSNPLRRMREILPQHKEIPADMLDTIEGNFLDHSRLVPRWLRRNSLSG